MKEVMIFPKVRKDPITGSCPKNASLSTSKNRFNILAAINLKGGSIPPVYYEILEECTTSALYLQFVKKLVENGILQEGDFFRPEQDRLFSHRKDFCLIMKEIRQQY